MKRDMDLIRTLLLRLEAIPTEIGDCLHVEPDDESLAIPNVTPAQIQYHLDLLRKHELLDCPSTQGMTGVVFFGLSWAGHDFIDTVRNEAIWRQTKKGAEAAGGWTFDLLKDLATGLVKTQIKKFTGVEV